MDVTCEQCKAEYEFDDALVGERGTTVKCSRCGHVFRVSAHAVQRTSLQLRFARDGRVLPLGSLRELQQRIASGEVGREDELGREGFPFRRLADVPELKNFFPGASLPASGFPASGPSGLPAGQGVGPGLAAPPAQRASARAPAQRTVMGIGPAGGRAADGGAPPPHFGLPQARPGADGDASTLPASMPAPSQAPQAGRAVPSTLPPPNTQLGGSALRAPMAAPVPASMPPASIDASAVTAARAPLPSASQRPAAGPSYAPMTGVPTRPADPAPHAPASPAPGRAPVEPAPRRLALDTAEAMDERPDAPITSAAPRREPPSGARAGLATEQRLERPGALAAAMGQRPASQAPVAPGVRLRVGEDEAPIERATGSSKLPLIAGAAVLLAAAGWGAVAYLGSSSPRNDAAPAPSIAAAVPAPQAAADGGPALAPQDAGSTAPGSAEPPPAKSAASAAAPESAAPALGKPDKAPERAADRPDKPERTERPEKTAEKPASASAPAKDYGALVGRGDQLFAQGDLAGAREAFTGALALRASGSEASSGLGFVLLAMGEPREAIKYLSRASANGYAEASIGLGDAQRKLGNKDDAIEAYGTYLARLPKGPRAKYARAQLDALEGGAGSGSANTARDTEEPQNAPSTDYRPAGEAAPSDEPTP